MTPGGTQTTVGINAPGLTLSYPTGVAVDAAGDVYIADAGDDRVVKVTPGGDWSPIGVGFANPIGVAVDAAGDVYIADAGNSQVVEITAAGNQTTVPATGLRAPNGVAVYSPADTDLAIAAHADVTVDATGPAGAAVTYTAPAVTDPGDATPPAARCTPVPGSTFVIGDTTVTCTATDPDDAPSSVTTSFTVSVTGAAGQLTALATAVQGVGPGQSLTDTVATAQAYLTAGDTSSACQTLTGFIHEVQAQSSKTIQPATASDLITAATQIRTVLAC